MDNVARQLITYAFIAKEFSRTSDIFTGLVPLFDPVFIELNGKIFSPKDFSSKAKELYGLKIPSQAAKELIPRFVEAGYLKAPTKDNSSFLCNYPEHRRVADKAKGDLAQKLEAILDEFESFASNLQTIDKIKFSRKELEEELFNHISSINFARSRNGKGQPLEKNTQTKRLDYLCARFIDDLAIKKTTLFENVADIASGALISEMVYDLASPSLKHKINPGLVVYVDTAFIMAIVGVNGKQELENAKELLNLLKEAKASPRALDITIEESHKVLRAIQKQANTDKSQIYGPAATEIKSGRLTVAEIAAINSSLETVLGDLGIKVSTYNADIDKTGLQRIPDDLIASLKETIGNYEHEDALIHDTMAVIITLRRRYGTTNTNDIFSSGHIFLTTNARLDKNALNFCRKNGFVQQNHIGPTVTNERMAAYLWLALGGKASDLPRKQLIVNCARMINPKKDLLDSINEFLEKTDPEKSTAFHAIMSQPRSCQLAMDLTLGDSSILTEENIEEIYERIREDVAFEKVQHINELASNLESTSAQLSSTEESLINSWITDLRWKKRFIWTVITILVFIVLCGVNYGVYMLSEAYSTTESWWPLLAVTSTASLSVWSSFYSGKDLVINSCKPIVDGYLSTKLKSIAERANHSHLLAKHLELVSRI